MLPALLALHLPLSLPQDAPAPRPWGPEQAIGAPDTPQAGDRPTAWASRASDAGEEWLRVRFGRPLEPLAVRVFESCAPGALVAVRGIDAAGERRVLWTGRDPLAPSRGRGVALVPLGGGAEVVALELVLDCAAVAGWNEIDAVGLHDAEGRLWWATGAEASSTYADGPPPAAQEAERQPVELAGLAQAWSSPADALLAEGLRERAAGWDEARATAWAAELVALQATAGDDPGAASFEGVWDTRYGPLRLSLDGERASGLYATNEGRIEGTLSGDRLEFRYSERDASGEGWFRLRPDGRGFEGRWRAEGETRWRDWSGERRPPPERERRWLIVLEAPWEGELAEEEYSFGAMLRAIFEHAPDVEVRQRAVLDGDDFASWCRELAFLEEPVYLFLATHATRAGLQCRAGTIGPDQVAEALQHARSLRLVHFSACEALAGEMPEKVLAACARHPAFAGVSGYDVSVDWMASALVEFTYLDLLLNRRLPPARAAAETLRLLRFAGDAVDPKSPLPAAHFRFLPCERAPSAARTGSEEESR